MNEENRNRIHAWLGQQPISLPMHVSLEPAGDLKSPSFASEDALKNRPTVQTNAPAFFSEPDKASVQSSRKKTSVTHVASPLKESKIAAATKIQASWRGFLARSQNPRAIEIRQELRARRTEQYISLICNELQDIKSKQDSDKRMRDLQTEAIRFMWTQIRQLQKRFRDFEQSPRLQKNKQTSQNESKDSRLKPCNDVVGKKLGNSENLNQDELSHVKDSIDNDASVKDNLDAEKENEVMKETVQQLQLQVIQLQNALLSFSDKFLDVESEGKCEDGAATEENCHQAEDDGLLESVVVKEISPTTDVTAVDSTKEEKIPSNAPRRSLKEILLALDSSLVEKELWSICEQAALSLKSIKTIPLRCVSLDTTFLRKDGTVTFSPTDLPIEAVYLAPEQSQCEGAKTTTAKARVFGLSVTLWSAADHKVKEGLAPCLSNEFETLLVKMSDENATERADLDAVIKMCQSHHTDAQSNSLEMCASLYAEACDLKRCRGKRIGDSHLKELVSRDIEKQRNYFRSNVVDQLNNFTFQLKPASDRVLLPKPSAEITPHEALMHEIRKGNELKDVPEPVVFTVKDLYEKNPELLQRLNVLPGQQRRNVRTLQSALRRRKRSEPRPPFPSPPVGLRTELRGSDGKPGTKSCSVILRWQPVQPSQTHGSSAGANKIVGYRIYVNGQPKGIVTGGKCRALLDGLRFSAQYRIQVCAVSGVGESDPSNIVIVHASHPAPVEAHPRGKIEFFKTIYSSHFNYFSIVLLLFSFFLA
ncbi:unnamed protein product [Clavelina lepadiformis]|uniref:Fibronectin type-III domain-containing protein n=1 Tax=Clavelina lepadiformis TaxID=159417 RepID=A0ABP0EZF9_CLALP